MELNVSVVINILQAKLQMLEKNKQNRLKLSSICVVWGEKKWN